MVEYDSDLVGKSLETRLAEMSEITPEERARLRKVVSTASALPWKVEGCYSSNTNVRAIRADGVGFSVTHLSAMRDNWAEDAAYIVAACNIAPRLLDALEATEKELVGADAEIASLRDELEDCKTFNNSSPQVLCDIARLLGVYEHCQESGDDMGNMVLDELQSLISDKQKAEVEVTRLTAERDWLAERCSECCEDDEMYSDPHEKRIVRWKEAARKAVEGEGK